MLFCEAEWGTCEVHREGDTETPVRHNCCQPKGHWEPCQCAICGRKHPTMTGTGQGLRALVAELGKPDYGTYREVFKGKAKS